MRTHARRWPERIAAVWAALIVAMAFLPALGQPPSPSSSSSAPRAKDGIKIRPRSVPLRGFGKIEKPETLIRQILDEHNKIRADKKLALFVPNEKLAEAARKHAEDMVAMSAMTHTGSDGSNIAQRLDRVAYPYFKAGENVAFGFPTAEGVMKGWMNSDGHRANILGGFSEIGIGVAVDKRGVPYYCVDFGVSRQGVTNGGGSGPASAAALTSAAKSAEEIRAMGREAVRLLNEERAKRKLAPLKISSKLEQAAQTHASHMASQDKLSALGANGDTFLRRLKRVRYDFRTAAQNLGSGPEEPRQLVESWLNSSDPDAKSNALGKFAQVGVSCCAAKNGTLYWCAIFGTPSS